MTHSETDELADFLLSHTSSSSGESDEVEAHDPYIIERELKRSTSGITQVVWYRGVDGSRLGPFVRKCVRGGIGLGSAYREISAAQKTGVHFKHLPRVVEYRDNGDTAMVVTEYIQGSTLAETIAQMNASERLAFTAQFMPAVCEAAEELHEACDTPLIHRDIKPTNIICPKGDPFQPVLIDLGIARKWHEGATTDTVYFGTRTYAPPEQFGFGQTDVRSDVYALGLLIFFCLTGRDSLHKDRDEEFADPCVPEVWRRCICQAADLDPTKRFASARAMAAACRDAAELVSTGRTSRAYADVAAKPSTLQAEISLEPSHQRTEIPVELPLSHAENSPQHSRVPDSLQTRLPQTQPLDISVVLDKFFAWLSSVTTSVRTFAESSMDPQRSPRLWGPRNIVIVAMSAIFIGASFYCATQMTELQRAHSIYYLYMYLCWMPYCALMWGYALMNKKWLRKHVTFFRTRTVLGSFKPFLIVFGVLTVFVIILVNIS